MDLIGDLATGRVTADEAEATLERLQEAGRQDRVEDWAVAAGMSPVESQAYLGGADVARLARWRATGWPSTCCRCATTLNYLVDDWMVAVSTTPAALMHVECPVPALADSACAEPPEVTVSRLTWEDQRMQSTTSEMRSILDRVSDGEISPSQAVGFIESVYFDSVALATIDAYEQVYGRSAKRAPDDEAEA